MRLFMASLAAGALLAAGTVGAQPKAAKPAAAGGLPVGSYECWGNGAARMLLNFTVTAPGKYRASDGSMGTFTVNGDKVVKFTGYIAEATPDGFSIVYHEPKGIPTVSFRSARGGEAEFCEKA